MSEPLSPSPPTLARRLRLPGAVIIGASAMIGAGIFAAPGPAAAAAGSWLLAGLALAAGTAWVNAMSSARLAALHPEAGGTYLYARERLGAYPGFLAGWAFVVGKTASLAAMALAFGVHLAPEHPRPAAIAAVVAMATVNYLGVEKTARVAGIILALVLGSLAVVVTGAVAGGFAPALPAEAPPGGLVGVLQAGGLLFFAFAGYARLATLGEEVVDPETTIPRAITLALGFVVVVYAVVLGTALFAIGPGVLATAPAPLAAAVESGPFARLAPIVRGGAVVATLGALLSLMAGVSRTTLAMARRRELPGFLAAVHPLRRTPHRAEIASALVVSAVVMVADLRNAIGFSSFAVLTYYALTNASAMALPEEERRMRPRWLPVLGIALCALLAFSLPGASIVGGCALLAVGSLVWLGVRSRER